MSYLLNPLILTTILGLFGSAIGGLWTQAMLSKAKHKTEIARLTEENRKCELEVAVLKAENKQMMKDQAVDRGRVGTLTDLLERHLRIER